MSAASKAERDLIASAVESNIWDPDVTTWTIAQTRTAQSLAEVASYANVLAGSFSTSKCEILLDGATGSFTTDNVTFDPGGFADGPAFNFAAGGGLVIRPKPGTSPVITGFEFRPSGRGIVLYGLTFGTWNSVTRDAVQVRTVKSTTGHVIVIDSCSFGALNYPGKTTADFLLFAHAFKLEDCQSALAKNNEFNGVTRAVWFAGNHYSRSYNNDFKLVVGFPHNGYPDSPEYATRAWTGGAYIQIVANLDRGNTTDNASAYVEATIPHRDFFQFSTGVTTSQKLSVVIEDNVLIAPTANGILRDPILDPGQTQKLVLDTAILQITDSPATSALSIVLFNNIQASDGYFFQAGSSPGTFFVEYNSAVCPNVNRAGAPDGPLSSAGTFTPQGSFTSKLTGNIGTQFAAQGAGFTDGGGNLLCTVYNGTDGTNTPPDRFNGSFTKNGDGIWVWTIGLTVASAAKNALRNAIIAQFVPKTGVASGAKFT